MNMMMMNNMNNQMMMNNMNNQMMGNNMNNQMMMNNMNNQMMNNNMMNNNMVNPLLNNVMLMNNLNNIMANNIMMNNMVPQINNANPMNMFNQNNNLWNLYFQRKINNSEQTINIVINPEKLFIEAINIFKLRTGMIDQILKFIFNGKDVIPDIKISQTGITNNSTITVISLSDVQGA